MGDGLRPVPGVVRLRNLVAAVEAIDPLVVTGKVAGVSGLLIESRGGLSRLAVGARACAVFKASTVILCLYA